MTIDRKLLCCGNISFDVISTGDNKKGELSFQARPGGSVFNIAIQCARLGLPVSMLTKNAQDFLGKALLSVMRSENISTTHVVPEKKIKTGLAFARIDKKGNSSYLFYRAKGEHAAFKQTDLPPTLFRGMDVFHAGSGYSYTDHTFENTLKLMIRAKRKGLFTTYDPNWRPSRIKNKRKTRARIKKLIAHADLLKLSDIDTLGIFGGKTLSAALGHLPKNTVVTLGSSGSFFWDGKEKIHCPAFRVPVVDTIGAGDGFTAGLIYRYCLRGKDKFFEEKKENLAFASAVSSLVCTGMGATEGLKNIRQVRRFLRENNSSK
ncbi:MAG: carbohydrate kinase [Candidatus Tantalella remota]|nr:carbohydrate kinase [Candidatus Tantalella remota]